MQRYQVLSLSGGGFLGLYTASVLKRFEEHYNATSYTRAKLISGTSVGGIIGLAIACEKDAEAVCAALERNGAKIFPKRNWIRRAGSLIYPSARELYLRSVIDETIGDSIRIGDLKCPVLITSLDLTSGEVREFFGGGGGDTPDADVLVKDVALATSAAPTFLPLAQVGQRLYADGGLVANAPDLFAILKAREHFGVEINDIHMLSIGTTKDIRGVHGGAFSRRQWGIFQWMNKRRIIDFIMSGQMNMSIALSNTLLKQRYIHINTIPDHSQNSKIGMDKADQMAIDTLNALAEKEFNAVKGDYRVRSWWSDGLA